jgi:hypothetical protein
MRLAHSKRPWQSRGLEIELAVVLERAGHEGIDRRVAV